MALALHRVRGWESAREAQEWLWQQPPTLSRPQKEQQMLLKARAGTWHAPSHLESSQFPEHTGTFLGLSRKPCLVCESHC